MEKVFENKKVKYVVLLVCLFILFSTVLFYYSVINPILAFDSDDWWYMGYKRSILPDLNEWNPAKVFPETFQPIMSIVGVFLSKILGISIFTGMAYVVAFIMSALWTTYTFLVFSVLYKKVTNNWVVALLATGTYFFLHLSIYRSLPNSRYLFSHNTINCYYNYSIPGLLCAIMVLLLILFPKLSGGKLGIWNILFLVLAYFAVFSNLLVNIILTSYAFILLIFNGIDVFKKNKMLSIPYRFILALFENYVLVGIEIFFAFSLYFDSHGARASMLSNNAENRINLSETLKTFFTSFSKMNILCGIVLVILFALGIFIALKKKGKFRNVSELLLKLSLSGLLLFVYLILICAKAAPQYIALECNIAGFWFYILLILMISFANISGNKIYVSTGIISACLVLSVIPLFNTKNHFIGNNYINGKPENIVAFNDYIVDTVVEASRSGEESIVLKVPDLGSEDWPIVSYIGPRINNSLIRLGLMENPVDIKIEWNSEINERFGF